LSNNSTNTSTSQATTVATTAPCNPIGSVRAGYQFPSDRRIEMLFAPTGPFRPLMEEYLATAAKTIYKPGTLKHIPGSLAKFFRFVVEEERLDSFDRITPGTITRFIEAELRRGVTTRNFVGDLSTFFVWAISEHHSANGNPVIGSIHRPLT